MRKVRLSLGIGQAMGRAEASDDARGDVPIEAPEDTPGGGESSDRNDHGGGEASVAVAAPEVEGGEADPFAPRPLAPRPLAHEPEQLEPEAGGDTPAAVSSTTEPQAPGPAAAAQLRRRSVGRRALGWMAPVAHYLRGFVLHPVLEQMEAREAHDAQLAAVLPALVARQDGLEAQLTALHQKTDVLLQRLEEARDRQRETAELQADAVGWLRGHEVAIANAFRESADRQEAMAALLARMNVELETTRNNVGHLLGLAGPRFDELEVKVRPVMDYDAESYAVRMADGYVMAPKAQRDFALMLMNAPSGGLEAGVRRVLQALIQPGMTVADVGANVGLHTIACAWATGPSGQVHAFEPEPGPRAQLEKMLRFNGLSWVRVHARAAGRGPGKATLHMSPVIGHSSLYELPEDEEGRAELLEVEVESLDQAIPPSRPLDVVKIDVEGAELEVLAGMQAHLEANPDIAIVAEFGPSHLERVGVDPQAWWDAFHGLGFRAYAISEPKGTCAPIRLDEALAHESLNLAFVRRGGRAQSRLPRP